MDNLLKIAYTTGARDALMKIGVSTEWVAKTIKGAKVPRWRMRQFARKAKKDADKVRYKGLKDWKHEMKRDMAKTVSHQRAWPKDFEPKPWLRLLPWSR